METMTPNPTTDPRSKVIGAAMSLIASWEREAEIPRTLRADLELLEKILNECRERERGPVKVHINSREFGVSEFVSYKTIIELAGERDGASVMYWWRGTGDCERSGTLCRGQTVRVGPGMHFSAVMTGNA